MIDSTDRERLVVIKEEIYRMLADEVSLNVGLGLHYVQYFFKKVNQYLQRGLSPSYLHPLFE